MTHALPIALAAGLGLLAAGLAILNVRYWCDRARMTPSERAALRAAERADAQQW